MQNSGRERTSAFVYSVGWTQHTVGVQYIRAAAIIQQLLGNMGRPGGGIVALRGHASIQGSTDIPTLYDTLPGYLPMPHAEDVPRASRTSCRRTSSPSGWWGNFKAYWVSLMKAYFGEHATEDNDWLFERLPRIDEDNSVYWTLQQMLEGKVKGYIIAGENPAVGNANGKANRLGLAKLDWLVVRDLVEIESASFWYDSPEIESGELAPRRSRPRSSSCPPPRTPRRTARSRTRSGCCSGTGRRSSRRSDCRSELWFYFHLGEAIKEKLEGLEGAARRAACSYLQWDYPTHASDRGADAEAVLAEISGYEVATRQAARRVHEAEGRRLDRVRLLDLLRRLQGRRQPGGAQEAALGAERTSRPSGRGRGPPTGASSTTARRPIPDGNPWSERKKLRLVGRREVDGPRRARLRGDEAARLRAARRCARREDAIAGDHPFIMQADGRSWLFVPQGLEDGPLPTHYEPHESPFGNPLYAQRANPAPAAEPRADEDPYNPIAGEPGRALSRTSMTTYRLTEHHTAGGMSRSVPYLAELQPAMFCEVSPELAEEAGLEHGGWATIYTTRSAIEARVLVTTASRR